MSNPTLKPKTEGSLTVEEKTKKLFQLIYQEEHQEDKSDEQVPRIKVSTLISKMAFYYEKIRNSVDYKEDHLLRKNAIERILKRQIVIDSAIQKLSSQEIAKHLLVELIRAGYLLNNKLPETKINEVAGVVEKYVALKKASGQSLKGEKTKAKIKTEINSWIIALAASEIEERLGREPVSQAIISYMYDILIDYIELPDDVDYREDKDIQIYLSIYRNFLKFDRDMLSFILFKYYNSGWKEKGGEKIEAVGSNILSLQKAVNEQLDHPLAPQLNNLAKRYTVFFSILRDVITEDPSGIYESFKKDPILFPRAIKRICNKKYKQSRAKVWRAAIRSIIYIFLTKSLFAVLLEVPANKWLGEDLNQFSLFINISFPALLLFVIVFFIKLPAEANTARIIQGVEEIVFKEKTIKEPIVLRRPLKRSSLMNTVFGIIYTITFFFSFGMIIWGLNKINFSPVSIIIFLFFLAFVSFFSIRIKKSAHELVVVESRENIFSFLVDFFYIPIVAAGKWLSERFSRINVFVFVLDFIIEAPFKIFVEVAEEWTKYVKERRDEIT